MELFDIPGYEGLYAVTKDGRVWSHSKSRIVKSPTNSVVWHTGGHYLKPHRNALGYLTVSLRRNNKRNTRTIHRLVALTLLPLIPDKPHVNHIDGDKANNQLDNLEWVDRKENARHAVNLGLYKDVHGENNGASKLSENDILAMRHDRREGVPVTEIALRYETTLSNAYLILNGTTWSHLPL